MKEDEWGESCSKHESLEKYTLNFLRKIKKTTIGNGWPRFNDMMKVCLLVCLLTYLLTYPLTYLLTYLFTYLLIYLLTYLLTYLRHGAESLRS